jgi:hypothetical protein
MPLVALGLVLLLPVLAVLLMPVILVLRFRIGVLPHQPSIGGPLPARHSFSNHDEEMGSP